MTTIDGGLGVLIKVKGALFWTLLVLAVALLVAWVVVAVIAYVNRKALSHYTSGVMPWRSEPPLDWKLEELQGMLEMLFEKLDLLLVRAGEAEQAATERRKRTTSIRVNMRIAYDRSCVAEQLMAGMATRWMALATMLINVPLVYVVGLFSTQGSYALLTISMVGSFVLVIGLGYLTWDMRQYIAHHSNVDQHTMIALYLTIIAFISTKTVESYISGSEAAHIDMYELGNCDAQRKKSKNAVTRMLQSLGDIKKNASQSLCQAYGAVLLSLATLLCAYFASEAAISTASLMWAALTAAAICYGISSRHLRTFRDLLRLMQQKVFEEVCRKHSITNDVQKKAFVNAAIQALRDTLHHQQSTTKNFLEVMVVI